MGIDPRGFGLGSDFFGASDRAGQNFGLPLSGQFEAGKRGLDDELTATLAAISGMRPQIESQGQLGLARLDTDFGRDFADLQDSLIGRGIFQSGIRVADEAELGNLYERQRQDLTFGVGASLADLANQEAQTRLGHQQGLQELMLQLAQSEAANPYSSAPTYLGPRGGGGGKKKKGGAKKKRRR